MHNSEQKEEVLRSTTGIFKNQQNQIPFELYHHPLKVPGAKNLRNTVTREDYSPEEIDELEFLRRQNKELKNQVLSLKQTVKPPFNHALTFPERC